jgi:galactokinase
MTREDTIESAERTFREQFDDDPAAISWAPGRLELLGNHTDYNDGLVLSVALDVGISIAASRQDSPSPTLEVFSAALNESRSASLDPIERSDVAWVNYPLGVLHEIAALGVRLPSFRMAVTSCLPFGAGVSSSAAFELATAEAVFALCGGRPDDDFDVAKLCQRAEVDIVGMPCGLLDQFSSLFGRRDHALFLDCQSLTFARAPLDENVALVIADTQVEHALVDGQYSTLRRHCESAARRLGELLGRDMKTLRDASLEEFLDLADRIDESDRRRAEHIFRENARVLEGRAALDRGDVSRLGELMVTSHESSRDLFGNSCVELDALVEIARDLPGCLGGKLSGGGFGGVTVNLVESQSVESFTRELADRYNARFPHDLRVFVTSAGDGADIVRGPVQQD